MKMLTGLVLACAMMAVTNAAAVPGAEPDRGGVRRVSIQHDAEPEMTSGPSVQIAAGKAKPVLVTKGESIQDAAKHGRERKPDFMPLVQSIQRVDGVVLQGSPCDGDWICDNPRCFLFIPTSTTWANAEMNCQARGGNLASVRSFDEYHFIQGIILKQTQKYPPTWIGGSDAQQEGTWLWSDGSRFTSLIWCQGQPNKSGGCLQMNYGDQNCWDDTKCKNQLPFVCSKTLESCLG